MKKIVLLVVSLLMFSSVAYAASINGTFKGNNVVKVYNNGKEITAENTPAIIYNGNTMVPISMLRQLGAEVVWNANTYSVNVSMPNNQVSNNDFVISKSLIEDLKKKATDLGSYSFRYTYSGGDSTAIEFSFNATSNVEIDIIAIANISKLALKTDAEYVVCQYNYTNGATETAYIFRRDIENYDKGTTSYKDFYLKWIISSPYSQTTNNNNSTTSPTTPIKTTYPELYSNDGKVYLGKLTSNTFDSESIFNEFGTYGSKFSSKSIWNEFGTYGSQYSSESAFNDLASKPPIIVLNGKTIGYLTTNSYKTNAVSPYSLLSWLKDRGY